MKEYFIDDCYNIVDSNDEIIEPLDFLINSLKHFGTGIIKYEYNKYIIISMKNSYKLTVEPSNRHFSKLIKFLDKRVKIQEKKTKVELIEQQIAKDKKLSIEELSTKDINKLKENLAYLSKKEASKLLPTILYFVPFIYLPIAFTLAKSANVVTAVFGGITFLFDSVLSLLVFIDSLVSLSDVRDHLNRLGNTISYRRKMSKALRRNKKLGNNNIKSLKENNDIVVENESEVDQAFYNCIDNSSELSPSERKQALIRIRDLLEVAIIINEKYSNVDRLKKLEPLNDEVNALIKSADIENAITSLGTEEEKGPTLARTM